MCRAHRRKRMGAHSSESDMLIWKRKAKASMYSLQTPLPQPSELGDKDKPFEVEHPVDKRSKTRETIR